MTVEVVLGAVMVSGLGWSSIINVLNAGIAVP